LVHLAKADRIKLQSQKKLLKLAHKLI
jgi:hypothetical protein